MPVIILAGAEGMAWTGLSVTRGSFFRRGSSGSQSETMALHDVILSDPAWLQNSTASKHDCNPATGRPSVLLILEVTTRGMCLVYHALAMDRVSSLADGAPQGQGLSVLLSCCHGPLSPSSPARQPCHHRVVSFRLLLSRQGEVDSGRSHGSSGRSQMVMGRSHVGWWVVT